MNKYDIGDIFTFDAEYPERAKFCNDNNLVIKPIGKNENGERLFQIQEIPEPTKEELLAELRGKREHECFSIINRGQLWYATLSDEQKEGLATWYQDWLDVTEQDFIDEESMDKIIPIRPEWLK